MKPATPQPLSAEEPRTPPSAEGRRHAALARARRIAITLVVPVLLGVAGAWLAIAAFGYDSVATGPFQVRLSAAIGRGVTDVALPPFGTLRADTHLAPLHLRLALEDVNVDKLEPLLTDPRSPVQLAERVGRALRGALWPLALRVLALGGIGALALGTLAYRLGRRALVALLAGIVFVAGAEGITALTYDARAFLSPSYSGSLRLVPDLFGPVRGTVQRVGYFRNELERIVASAGRAYTAIEANPLGRGDEIRVLSISDVHLSTLGYDFAERLADAFDVDVVLDTGDTSSFGTGAEAAILSAIPRFDRPYVWVRGNHDSIAFQRAVAGYDQATVLDGTSATVAGITFYGLGDPYFVSARGAPQGDQEIRDLVASAGPRIVSDVEAMPGPPDVVAVHDDRMAQTAAGLVPLVVSGHFHKNADRAESGTLFLQVGTTGGAGPTGFTAEGDVPFSAQVLYFRPGVDGRPTLVAWDVIEQEPATGSFSVERRLVEQEYGRLIPSPASETATPTPTVGGSVAGSGSGEATT